jgi:hypothetical protein
MSMGWGGDKGTLLLCESLVQFFLIEADDYLVVHDDNWHSHLPRFFYHFVGFFFVLGNVIIGEIDSLLRKILFRSMTPRSSLSTVNNDGFVCHLSSPLRSNFGKPRRLLLTPVFLTALHKT